MQQKYHVTLMKTLKFGLAMPGSRLKSITNAVRREIAALTSDDVIVMWGGTNDRHISSFMKK